MHDVLVDETPNKVHHLADVDTIMLEKTGAMSVGPHASASRGRDERLLAAVEAAGGA